MNNNSNRRYRVGPVVNGVLEAWGVYVRVGADKWKRIAVLGTQADAVEYAAGLETAEAKDGKAEPENQDMNKPIIKTSRVSTVSGNKLVTMHIVRCSYDGGKSWEEIARTPCPAHAAAVIADVKAEAKAGTDEPENQSMNNIEINEIVGRYLAANPETAKRLVQAATQFEAEKERRREAYARKMECVAAVKGLDEAIRVAQDAVNKLKGDVLRLQKERKAAVAELEKATGACSALGI